MKSWKPAASGVAVCAAPPADESVTLDAVLQVTVPNETSNEASSTFPLVMEKLSLIVVAPVVVQEVDTLAERLMF